MWSQDPSRPEYQRYLIIDLASSPSPRYLSRSPSSVDMIGALWARENPILHSLWIAFSTSSSMEYYLVLPSRTRWTFSTLGLWGFLTVRLMRYHIRLLSSRLTMRQSRRCTFLSPLACFGALLFELGSIWDCLLAPPWTICRGSVCWSVRRSRLHCQRSWLFPPSIGSLSTFLAFPSFNRIIWRLAGL